MAYPGRDSTWYKGGIQESIGETVTVTHHTGDMEPEESTSCSHVGTPVEQQGDKSTHKTFNPKCFLSTRNEGTGERAETEGAAYPAQLEVLPMHKHHT